MVIISGVPIFRIFTVGLNLIYATEYHGIVKRFFMLFSAEHENSNSNSIYNMHFAGISIVSSVCYSFI